MALKLQPSPTFWAKVLIPLPGNDKGEEIEVEFKHMTREEFTTYQDVKESVSSDATAIMRVAKNWKGVEGDFNEANINLFLQNYHGAGRAIARTFVQELMQVRLGN